MTVRNVLIFTAFALALVYLWPSQAAKVAQKVGNTTVSAVKAGVHEASK